MGKKIDLSLFEGFVKFKEEKKVITKDVWCYTRVSSLDQMANYSIENQKESARTFAVENGYNLVNSFGGTYESAKGDFSRKEFSAMIEKLKSLKKKPYALLIYKMNRFSRSGGGSVGLVDYIVNKLSVHLIEIISGDDTTTERGLVNIQNKLLKAREENITRLEHTVPGMISFVKSGNRLGISPLGYDHYGPKVNDFKKRAISQEIRLNETGHKLRLAWQWKLDGDTDVQIIKKLENMGVKITPQRISAMWRNMFYCGVISNNLIGRSVVVGKHEPMVSQEVFLKVNGIIKEIRKSGYTVAKDVEERPLTNHLYCSECGAKLTSYENKKKHVHYYKCQKCNGVSINANTPATRAKNVGAHDLFVQQLSMYQLDDSFSEIYKFQIKKMLGNITKEQKNEDALVKKQLTELKNKKEKLEERFAFGEITEDMYSKFNTKITADIAALEPNLDIDEKSISNFAERVDKAVDFSCNIHNYWMLANVDNKKRIQKLVFPNGLILDAKNRQYLTSKVNELFVVNTSFSNEYMGKEKGLITDKSDKSSTVAGTRVELVTSGL